MQISYAIVAHTNRHTQAANLSHQLGNASIAWDDGQLGEGLNHDRAWRIAATQSKANYGVVLEDDAILTENFLQQAALALAEAPAPIVSFYTGTSRPPQYQARIKVALAQNPTWILADQLLHHVAVAIRTELIPDMLNHVAGREGPADYRIGEWAQTRGHHITYTAPSLVDHADGPTLINHFDGEPRTEQRVAWVVGERDSWQGKVVHL